MVVFTCQNCGESVNKPKVEKHYLTICKNKTYNLTCVDCIKDFTIDDYKSHTQCLTEEERYAAKGFVAKEQKGLKKQNTWVEMIQSVLDEQINAPAKVIKIIETVCKFNNTPRKKPKFFNFAKNVCGPKTNPKDIEQAWNLISVKLSSLAKNSENKPNKEDILNDKENLENDEDNKVNDKKVEINISESENPKIETESEKKDSTSSEKMTKKQKKLEKKRQKYEAELQNAAVDCLEEENIKKEKKKKNRNNSTNEKEVDNAGDDIKTKNKKRKRQDTIVASDTVVNTNEPESAKIDSTKVLDDKKKKKIKDNNKDDDDANVSCLHDENVAKTEVLESCDKFDWHAIIISILKKKDNEMQFKRLQKKVLTEYSQSTGREVDDRIAEKFIKKLKSAPNVKVDKNRVILV